MAEFTLVYDWGTVLLPPTMRPAARLSADDGAGSGSGPLEKETGPRQPSRVLRILLVEDDQALSLMYRVRLEGAGHEVATCGDGRAALELVRREAFDLVFLDIGLPGMDGLEVLQAMRAMNELKHLPVVILSNYSEPPMRERGLSLGAIEYLVKADVTPSWLADKAPGWAGR